MLIVPAVAVPVIMQIFWKGLCFCAKHCG